MDDPPLRQDTAGYRMGRHCASAAGITGLSSAGGPSAASQGGPDLKATLRQPAQAASVLHGGEATVVSVTGPGGEDAVLRRTLTPRSPVPQAWDHPHLVGVLGSGDGGRETVLRRVPGGSLIDLVSARGPLPVGEMVTLMVPLARALAHLHQAGAIHGDVSPQNIMFGSEGQPILIDPGLASSLGEVPLLGGTEGFVAPQGQGTRPGDVYAWAAVAWWVLTGTPPGAVAGRPPLTLLVPGVSEHCARLLEACLDVSSSDRPTASEAASELQAVQAAKPLNSEAAVTEQGIGYMRTILGEPPGRRGRGMTWRWPSKREGAARLSRSPAAHGKGRRGQVISFATFGVLAALAMTLAWSLQAGGERAVSQQLHVSGLSAPAGAGVAAVSEPPFDAGDVVARLDGARTQALKRRDLQALESIYVGASANLRADEATIGRLLESNQRFEGLGSRVESVRLLPSARTGADLLVEGEAIVSGYTLVDDKNRKVSHHEGTRTTLRWTLRNEGSGWRIVKAEAAP